MRAWITTIIGAIFWLLEAVSRGRLLLSIVTLEYLSLHHGDGHLDRCTSVVIFLIQMFYLLCSIPIIVNGVVCWSAGFGFTLSHRQPPSIISPLEMPHVDVIIFACREPSEVIDRTLRAADRIAWHSHLLHIYISDDGGDPAIQQITAELAALHPLVGISYCHRKSRDSAKAGNLRYIMGHTANKSGSPLVLFLDADMAPDTTILTELVPY